MTFRRSKLIFSSIFALFVANCQETPAFASGRWSPPVVSLPAPEVHLAAHKTRFNHPHADGLDALVEASASRNHVPTELVHRIIRVESGGNCAADNGIAVGIMQVQPATAASVGVYGNLKNCATGLEAGTRYLHLALARTGGNWELAATLYNAGLFAKPHRSAYSSRVMVAMR